MAIVARVSVGLFMGFFPMASRETGTRVQPRRDRVAPALIGSRLMLRAPSGARTSGDRLTRRFDADPR